MSAVGRRVAAAALAAALTACGGTPPGATVTTAAPTTAAPATPSASPTPRPTPIVSAKGFITVNEPASGETIDGGVLVSGEASVFEATVSYRVVTSGGKVLAEGFTTASAGAPQKGTFKTLVRFDKPAYGESGFIEVFERSPKDNTISDIVRVPVTIRGA